MKRALAVALACAATAAAAASVDTVGYTAAPQPYARIEIKHSAMNVRLALGIPKLLLLNLPAGERAHLKAVPLLGKGTAKINLFPGGEVTYRANLYDVAAGGRSPTSVPVAWLDKSVADDADGILSVFALNADHVAIVQPAAPVGGTSFVVARDGRGDPVSTVRIGDGKLRVIFDLRLPQTIMNSAAAQLVERAGLAKRAGKVGLWQPFPGHALPFETMTPAPGATLLGLPLTAPTARITEARARELDAAARAGNSTSADDVDAIVVTAQSRRRGDAWVIVGRDVTARCSRIELDRPGARWLFTCNFAG